MRVTAYDAVMLTASANNNNSLRHGDECRRRGNESKRRGIERADECEKSGDRLLLCMDATDRMLGFQLALESSQLVPRKWRMR